MWTAHNEIEAKWREILRDIPVLFPSMTKSIDVPSIEEIRKNGDGHISTLGLCELTLQPLTAANDQTTKATVVWKQREFMACSANFLANRCPFYNIRD